MGKRSDLTAAMVAAVGAILNPEGSPAVVPVTEFDGDLEQFNDEALYPSVHVQYIGRNAGENQTVGAVTQPRSFRFAVLFAYADKAAVKAALDEVDDNLPGELPTTDRLVTADDTEQLVLSVRGKMLYVQTYSVDWDA